VTQAVLRFTPDWSARSFSIGAMTRLAVAVVLIVSFAGSTGCSYLGIGGNRDDDFEETVSKTPCETECCCKTKRGYYVWYRCKDRAACDDEGGECLRHDLARCSH